MKLDKGTTISHYKILSEIGKGGMGEVYLAQDTKLNRKVAIKFLSDEFSKDKEKLNRFVQEAKAASALNHPNILTVYEIGETDGTRYIATEFIEGKTLNNYSKSKPLKFKSALDIAIQIASALDEAHSAGIVHRDIKPDNVMVRSNGLVKILDFGIAKLSVPPGVAGGLSSTGSDDNVKPSATADGSDSSEDKTAILVNTTPGMIIGTANYMSPEQAKGLEVDARTDIFSFGVLLYEMIAGHLPFEGETPIEMIGSILKDEAKPLNVAEIHPELEQVIAKTLKKDRKSRYRNAKELLTDLQSLQKRLEFNAELERTSSPDRSTEAKTVMLEPKTADGHENRTKVSAIKRKTKKNQSKRDWRLAAWISLFILIAGSLGYYFTANNSKQIKSIAVMPFVNESGDKDVEYLADGMTETLISSLSNIPNLSIKARSSVFRYKGKEITPKKVGEELNVQAVLLGRVVKRGEDLTLSLELVDSQTENVLWSEKFERKMKNLVSLQSEIARDVSNKLRIRLTTSEQEQITKIYTKNSEAQQLYLKGRYHWNRRNPRDFEKAIDLFKQAVEKDPNYPLAYTGLADTYALMAQYANKRPKEFRSSRPIDIQYLYFRFH